jgi:hypothetical protein
MTAENSEYDISDDIVLQISRYKGYISTVTVSTFHYQKPHGFLALSPPLRRGRCGFWFWVSRLSRREMCSYPHSSGIPIALRNILRAIDAAPLLEEENLPHAKMPDIGTTHGIKRTTIQEV